MQDGAAELDLGVPSRGYQQITIAIVFPNVYFRKSKVCPKHWFRTGMCKCKRLTRTRMNAARGQVLAAPPSK